MKYIKPYNESVSEIDHIMQNLIDDYGFYKPFILINAPDVLHTKSNSTIQLNDEEFIKELKRVSKKMESIGYIMTLQALDMEGRYNSSIIDRCHRIFYNKLPMTIDDVKSIVSNLNDEQKNYEITYLLFWFTPE